jgi:putative ABC transport system substrate-binding protein
VIDRRTFLAGTGTVLLAAPLGVEAQQAGKVWRIGSLHPTTAELAAPLVAAFEAGLADLGHIKGQTTTIEYRFVPPVRDLLRDAATELNLKVDILVAWGTVAAIAAKDAGLRVPLVFLPVGDPVALGLAQSLSHPGGNATGVAFEASAETYGKRLQLLKEVRPGVTLVATLGAADDPNVGSALESVKRAAPSLRLLIQDIRLRDANELDGSFTDMRKGGAQAVLVVAGAFAFVHRDRIAALAVAHRLPSVHGLREGVFAGGLISLGPDLTVLARQGAAYVDKILKGAKPADLPIEQPTKFELIINLKAARALGLTIPQSLLLRADEIIQ